MTKSTSSSSEELLPAEICRKVLQFLSARDASRMTAVNRYLRGIGTSKAVWESIWKRDVDPDSTVSTVTFPDYAAAKHAVKVNELKNALPSIKWYPLRANLPISAREGHLACCMTCKGERRVVFTGGFSDDQRIYILDLNAENWTVTSIAPTARTNFVYGASLTPLPGLVEEATGNYVFRAVRYGGFRAGGYSDESNETVLLEIIQPPNGEAPTAKWTTLMETNSPVFLSSGRAYHTATLLLDRYVVVIGGMRTNGCVLQPIKLDTHTWQWGMFAWGNMHNKQPSGRHGHSAVVDSKRKRLLLFGGGNGSDLLRSGKDNSEVWELALTREEWNEENINDPDCWEWNKLYSGDKEGEEAPEEEEDEDETDTDASNNQQDNTETVNRLSPAETLCLGRCHMSCKIAADMVLFFYGSGRPSTNGVLAFDLANDKFHRPNVTGHLPCPRFTGASAACLEEGYILTHGGYSSQLHDSIGQLDVIDLVPSLRSTFDKMPIDGRRPSHAAITDAQAEAARQGNNRGTHQDLMQMFFASLAAAQRRGGVWDEGDDSDDDDNDSDEDFEVDEMEEMD